MGRIAVVLSIEENTEDGATLDEAKIDLGGGDTVSAVVYSAPGDGSKPLPDDEAATVSIPGDSGQAVVGFADTDNSNVADDGEVYRYARDSSGAIVAWIRLYNDGRIELDADASIRIGNGSGYIFLAGTGQVDINGNFTVDP